MKSFVLFFSALMVASILSATTPQNAKAEAFVFTAIPDQNAVSYTHLTLPTICSV